MKRREFLGAVGPPPSSRQRKSLGRGLRNLSSQVLPTCLTGPTKNERPPLDPTEPLLQVD